MLYSNVMRVCLAVLCLPCMGYAADLTVTVKDAGGKGIQGADVAAVSFISTEPESTSFAKTDRKGKAVLSVSPGVMYQVLATKKGHIPSVRDQVFERMDGLCKGICAGWGAEGEVERRPGYPPPPAPLRRSRRAWLWRLLNCWVKVERRRGGAAGGPWQQCFWWPARKL